MAPANPAVDGDEGDRERVFALAMDAFWRRPLGLIGVQPAGAHARVLADRVEVRVGRYFQAAIPASSITLARAANGSRFCRFGVSVRRSDTICLIAGRQGAVEVRLAEPSTGSLLGRAVRFSILCLCLEQAQEFLAEVHRLQDASASSPSPAEGPIAP